jgi:hypothetical protein
VTAERQKTIGYSTTPIASRCHALRRYLAHDPAAHRRARPQGQNWVSIRLGATEITAYLEAGGTRQNLKKTKKLKRH